MADAPRQGHAHRRDLTRPRQLFAAVPKVARQLRGTAPKHVAPRCAPTGGGSEAVVGADPAATAFRRGSQGGAPAPGHGLKRCRAQVRSHSWGPRLSWERTWPRQLFASVFKVARQLRVTASKDVAPRCAPTRRGAEAVVGADPAATAFRFGLQGGAPAPGHGLKRCRAQVRSHSWGPRLSWERTWPRQLFASVFKVARQLPGTASKDVAPRCAPTRRGAEAVVGADLAATAFRRGLQGGAPAPGHGLKTCRAQVRSHRWGPQAATAFRLGLQGGAPAPGHGLKRCRAQVRSHRWGCRGCRGSGPGRDSFSPRPSTWRASPGHGLRRCRAQGALLQRARPRDYRARVRGDQVSSICAVRSRPSSMSSRAR